MYIHRPYHEKALVRSIKGTLHTIISGESGSGKSWMFKQVAKDNRWELFHGNFANAARDESITEEIFNALVPEGTMQWERYQQQLDAKLKALVAAGGVNAKRDYKVKTAEKLEMAFKCARETAGKKIAVLALDNLESIFRQPKLMEELGNIILLLDDSRYARYRVKLLMVGVPADVVEYYQKIPNLEPIGNRISEVPHVLSLKNDQVEEFVRKGFLEQLQLSLPQSTVEAISKQVFSVTLGIAQRIHEYCLCLAYALEDRSWVFSEEIFSTADREFIHGSIYQAYGIVDMCMNKVGTVTGRRNQVLYALGKINEPEFDSIRVEEAVRQHFPKSTHEVSLGINSILGDLSTEARPLLKRCAQGNAFRFADPRYLMCIRMMLTRSKSERVTKFLFHR
ncbi:MAG: AAA family ATPase [Opitutaceae bacterium]